MSEDKVYISKYTRQDALDDGLLIDVSEAAKKNGFLFPVAVTQALWASYIEPTEFIKSKGQSLDSRLWDTLFWLYIHIRGKEVDEYKYWVSFVVEHRIYAPNGVTVLRQKPLMKRFC